MRFTIVINVLAWIKFAASKWNLYSVEYFLRLNFATANKLWFDLISIRMRFLCFASSWFTYRAWIISRQRVYFCVVAYILLAFPASSIQFRPFHNNRMQLRQCGKKCANYVTGRQWYVVVFVECMRNLVLIHIDVVNASNKHFTNFTGWAHELVCVCLCAREKKKSAWRGKQ